MKNRRTYRRDQTRAPSQQQTPPTRLEDTNFQWSPEFIKGVEDSTSIRHAGCTDEYEIQCKKGLILMGSGCTYDLLSHNPKNKVEWYHEIKTKLFEEDARRAMARSLSIKGVIDDDIQYGVFHISKHHTAQKVALMRAMFSSLTTWASERVLAEKGIGPIGRSVPNPARDRHKILRSIYEKDDPKDPMIRVNCVFLDDAMRNDHTENDHTRPASIEKKIGTMTEKETADYLQQDLIDFINSENYETPTPPLDPKWTVIYLKALDFFTWAFLGDALLSDATTDLIDEVAPGIPFALWSIIQEKLNTNETQAELFSSRHYFRDQWNLPRHDAGTFNEMVGATSILLNKDTAEGQKRIHEHHSNTYKPLILRMKSTYEKLIGSKVGTVINGSESEEEHPLAPSLNDDNTESEQMTGSLPKDEPIPESGLVKSRAQSPPTSRDSASQDQIVHLRAPMGEKVYGRHIQDTAGKIEPLVLKYRQPYYNDPPPVLKPGGVTPSSMKAYFQKRKHPTGQTPAPKRVKTDRRPLEDITKSAISLNSSTR